MNPTVVDSPVAPSHSQTPVPAPSPVSAVAGGVSSPVTAEIVSVNPVMAPETKMSPVGSSSSFVLSSPDDNASGVIINKDDEIQRLLKEVERLRKMNERLMSSVSETTGGEEVKPKSVEQRVVDGFKSMFNTVSMEGVSKHGHDYKVTKYVFQFKNGRLHEYLFCGSGEKDKDHPQYDSLSEKEKELTHFYLKFKKAPGAKVEFLRREGEPYSIMDFTSALNHNAKEDAKKLIDGDTRAVQRAVYAMFSACCRRLFGVTYVLNKSVRSVTMTSVQRITPVITRTLFFESIHPGFNDLEVEERKKFSLGKGILYSTIFFIPDGKYLEECIDGLLDMLDVLKVLMVMEC